MEADDADSDERAKHNGAMEALAGELKLPLDQVRSVYEQHSTRLRSSARVRTYLPVLVARHARAALLRPGMQASTEAPKTDAAAGPSTTRHE
jgi:hypothetical protein